MLCLGLAAPVPVTLDVRVRNDPADDYREFGRSGSLMVAVLVRSRKEEDSLWLQFPIARAWGDDGRVPPPRKGTRYRKTVMLPAGVVGPAKVRLYWRPGPWGRRDLDAFYDGGLFAEVYPLDPCRPARLDADFDSRRFDAPDPSQEYGWEFSQ